jgi:hypothetical protein
MVKRELIDTGSNKRYVRRNNRGQFNEVDDVGRSLSADRRKRAKSMSNPGEGDKGDRPRSNRKATGKSRKKAAKRKVAWKKQRIPS